MRYAFLTLLIACWTLPIAAQDSGAAKYAAIVRDYEQAQAKFNNRIRAATTVAEQGKIFREEDPLPNTARRLLDLANANPKDAVAYESLTWIVANSQFGPAAEKPFGDAIQMLATQYADHLENEKLLEPLAVSPFPSSAMFLKAVHEKHPNSVVRGRAGLHWALHLKNYCRTVENVRTQPEFATNVEHFIGPNLFKQLKDADIAKLLGQADEILVGVQKDYPLVAYKKANLSKAADAELFEIRHLQIGKTAPELEGEDTNGKALKLSDYRGKVVVLVFWGTWCPHCMAMVPTERALVKRYDGKPFAMVGVNSDVDRDKLKPALVKHGITWRSFYDGPTIDGPIATRWNVQGWPAIYVLDAKGVIRFREIRGELLERAVAELMADGK
jgi:thiol-disulfide isomerase/thioredoxin